MISQQGTNGTPPYTRFLSIHEKEVNFNPSHSKGFIKKFFLVASTNSFFNKYNFRKETEGFVLTFLLGIVPFLINISTLLKSSISNTASNGVEIGEGGALEYLSRQLTYNDQR